MASSVVIDRPENSLHYYRKEAFPLAMLDLISTILRSLFSSSFLFRYTHLVLENYYMRASRLNIIVCDAIGV